MTPPASSIETQVAVLEARTDGRISSMEATFASFVILMDEREKAATERHKAAEAGMDRMEAMIAEMRASIASLRITIVITAVSSVLATVLGVSAFNATLYANMLAALQTGKEMAETQAEVQHIVERTAILLKKIEDEKNPPKPPPSD
jgi:multidrug efflux pump subunit AcrA (membrane-fusion protein)